MAEPQCCEQVIEWEPQGPGSVCPEQVLWACCVQGGADCVDRAPSECQILEGKLFPNRTCSGDSDANGIDDTCERPTIHLDQVEDFDPGSALDDPRGAWHELYPEFSQSWNCDDWEDGDFSGSVSYGDRLIMARESNGRPLICLVEYVTITIEVKDVDDPGGPSSFMDYIMATDEPFDPTDPPCTWAGTVWREVAPVHGGLLSAVAYIDDDGNQWPSANDTIEFEGIGWYRVDSVSWDVEVTALDAIPVLPQWGFAILTLLLLTGATLVFRRRRVRCA